MAIKQDTSHIKKCGFTVHISGRGTTPCANHDNESDCTKVPVRCKDTTVCSVCGYCQKDCVGHLGLKSENLTFGHRYVNSEEA